MAQQVKASTTKPGDLSQIPKVQMGGKREPVPASCLLTSACTHHPNK